MSAVEVRDLHKTYGDGSGQVHALRGVSLRVEPGRLVVVRGRSGSGKTTLLNLVGGLDRADSGSVLIEGAEVTAMDDDSLVRLRREKLGFVFQSFGLVPILSAAENIGVPLRLQGADPAERDERVQLLLALVGLEDHARQRPTELSGGQQQRVAIARALANEPAVLLADEPAGQPDSQTGRQVVELLRAVIHGRRLAALVATHDPALTALANTVLKLRDGVLVNAADAPTAA